MDLLEWTWFPNFQTLPIPMRHEIEQSTPLGAYGPCTYESDLFTMITDEYEPRWSVPCDQLSLQHPASLSPLSKKE